MCPISWSSIGAFALLFQSAFGFELKADAVQRMTAQYERKEHCLVFEDQFNQFDLSKWQHETTLAGGGNWEFQWYTNNRSNSYVRDGVLYLHPTFTSEFMGEEAMKDNGKKGQGIVSRAAQTIPIMVSCERMSGAVSGGNYINPIRSARIRTLESVAIRYGKVEVRARLPRGDWLWPAIWMMPKYASYGTWPASGEIDIMESRGNQYYSHGNISNIGSTLHWGPSYDLNKASMTHAEAILSEDETFADRFHTYGLEWSAEGLRTYVDDKTILQVDFDEPFFERGNFPRWSMNPWDSGDIGAPFDQEFYLILNLAVGGVNGFFPDAPHKPWSNRDPHAVNAFWNNRNQWLPTWGKGNRRAFAIDSVKIWSAEEEC
ncbi:glycoside hydrolase family 16 protein [Phycomyces blakesleeanus NRRL 1555(-)]|uniref:Glycoside hydrolase family 16 protein n=1 Tax=Phycomyces blakesleeanus (strain ATCC 8743b / DSM 1359 / FGSC 10004 / NBRC 33097 / NRRL 1555) TaxID=763407 RepID=A0A162NGF2_PHYB8|nr:glycoside hydrolase family 16 protein [Phycomyces blakesleeanus NRRL 1555(-)]OAD74008.1 glycoside hydrolase family 16 protein [Phycomyces blakesleeanus NRRL 1555(-)]|eukprot:XP_018292048.1 glycoside hydrolase family 16 protein [Phycomyces blakesleeanus NRRL 1555(-)]